MALAYHYRLINKIRSILATYFTSYDPFAAKLLEHFRHNPHYPFVSTRSFVFEYHYRRWSSISSLIFIQIFLLCLAIYCYSRWSSNDYWLSASKWLFLVSVGLGTIFLCFNLMENFKMIRIVLSPLDFLVSIYINDNLKEQCSIDRAYICLHRIESYKIFLYHLVFVIEDLDFIEISDYFPQLFPLRQIGQRLAENLSLGYLENEHWIGKFPKYDKLKRFLRRYREETKI